MMVVFLYLWVSPRCVRRSVNKRRGRTGQAITALLSASKILTAGFQWAAVVNMTGQKWKTAQHLCSSKRRPESCFGLQMIDFSRYDPVSVPPRDGL